MKKRALFLVFLFFFSHAFSQQIDEQFLIAERITSVEREKILSSVTIHSNVRNALVYINGQYQGQTPCTINDLAPGTYRLRVSKQGYNSVSHYISVSRKRSSSFYVELERLVGYIQLFGIPENCTVYCDDELLSSYRTVSNTLELTEGYHTITVKKFGYADFSSTVYVTRRLLVPVHISLVPTSFAISNFNVSKKQINPAYKNALGSCNFSFRVTAPETATISITNQEGQVVYTYSFPTFTTWEQKISWNGRTNLGDVLPDGMYRATLSAGQYTESAYIEINSSLRYRIADITHLGSSIGNVPLSYTQGERTTFLGIEASPVFNLENENHFKEIPVSFFFGLNPVSWFELSTKFSIHAQNGFVPVSLHGSAKFSAQAQISKKTQFSFAAIFRYGGVLNALQGAPGSESANAGISYSNGADVGNGLGVGIALGFDGSKLFGGLSTEYICGALRGNLGDGTHIWKNGLALEFHPMPEISLKAWAALNSLFTSDTSITGQKINMFRAIDTGLGASFMLGSSSAIIFVRTNALMYINDTNYISATLGLSCIF